MEAVRMQGRRQKGLPVARTPVGNRELTARPNPQAYTKEAAIYLLQMYKVLIHKVFFFPVVIIGDLSRRKIIFKSLRDQPPGPASKGHQNNNAKNAMPALAFNLP